MTAKREEDLYLMEVKAEKAHVSQASTSNLQEWHEKFGHLNEKDLKDLVRNGKVHGVAVKGNENLLICEVYIRGKQTQTSFPKSTSRSTEILELVHTDLCGPMNVESFGGSKYFATFIDDKTRYMMRNLFSEKEVLFENFLEFKVKVEKQTRKSIKTIRSDNGGEYRSHELEDYLKKEGIRHQLTIEYTSEQNGIAERKNRTLSLVEMARCMLLQSGLSPILWAEAILTANYIRNRYPTRSLEGKIPHELWSGKIPTAIHFQVFGTKAYMLGKSTQRKLARGKFGEKTIQCIFVGYSTESKAYRLWNPESRRIRRSRNVKFVKTFAVQQESKDFMDEEFFQGLKRNASLDNNEGGDNSQFEFILTNGNNQVLGTPENDNEGEIVPEDDPPNVHEGQVPPGMKIGRRRPTKILTGQRGRPRKQPHFIPIQEDIEAEDQEEVQGQQGEQPEINKTENEDLHLHDQFEYAGLIEEEDPQTAKKAM